MSSRWKLLCVLLLLVGCSGSGNPEVKSGVTVRGKILKGGEPLKVPNQDIGVGMIEVVLIPTSNPANSERALAKPDGTFELIGPGKGLPPGDYKLAIYQRDQGPGSDQLGGAFSEAKTPISVQLSDSNVGGKMNLDVIELDSYAPKK